jgi:hypothetical protein
MTVEQGSDGVVVVLNVTDLKNLILNNMTIIDTTGEIKVAVQLNPASQKVLGTARLLLSMVFK